MTAVRERRFENRGSMCPYNSGTIRIRPLPFPSITGTLTCGKLRVAFKPGPMSPMIQLVDILT